MNKKTKDLVLPSGLTVTIREATGADDDIFSGANIQDNDVINRYVAAMVVKGPLEGPFTEADAKLMLLRDKYFILLTSRIFSLGERLIFEYTWNEHQSPTEYDIDITQFIWDYTTPFPKKGDDDYFDQRIAPYIDEREDGKWINFTAGDWELRFQLIDGEGEAYLLKLTPEQRSVNKQLIARQLQYKEGETWMTVNNFKPFSSREMVIIRNKVGEVDADVLGLITITNPMTFETQTLSLLGITDFFFPTKI